MECVYTHTFALFSLESAVSRIDRWVGRVVLPSFTQFYPCLRLRGWAIEWVILPSFSRHGAGGASTSRRVVAAWAEGIGGQAVCFPSFLPSFLPAEQAGRKCRRLGDPAVGASPCSQARQAGGRGDAWRCLSAISRGGRSEARRAGGRRGAGAGWGGMGWGMCAGPVVGGGGGAGGGGRPLPGCCPLGHRPHTTRGMLG